MTVTRFRRRTDDDQLASFVSENRKGLWHAARLLGGYEAATMVDDLAARLRDEEKRTRATQRRARALHALLTLRNVHDPDRPECGFFALIDPADPVTFEICALADGLRAALARSATPEMVEPAA